MDIGDACPSTLIKHLTFPISALSIGGDLTKSTLTLTLKGKKKRTSERTHTP